MNHSLTKSFNTGQNIRNVLHEKVSGINREIFNVIKRAIVIEVSRTINDDNLYSRRIPPYSIKAAIMGEDIDIENINPNLMIYKWYRPLMSIHNISIPEVGEEVLIIRENTLINSSGYWVSRVNDSALTSTYLAREYAGNGNNKIKYGFKFDVKKIHADNSGIQSDINNKQYCIPAKLGDVISQGRTGTYIRHSFVSNNTGSGILEMGLLQSRIYLNNDTQPTLGKTRTKSVHMRGKLSDLTKVQKYTLVDIQKIGPFSDGSFQNVPVNIDVGNKNFIANIAEEFYSISNSKNAKPTLYREVLGEELEKYQQGLNEKINNLIDTIDDFVNTTSEFLEEFLDHKHVLPEINIQLPDKEISFKESFRQPSRLVPAGERTINIKGTPVTETIETPSGPKEVTKFVGGQTIKIRNPPRLINGRIKTVTKKKTIKFDEITIGGEGNKRVTTSPTTTQRTQFISDNINELFAKFRKSGDDILSLTDETRDFLSKTHFIN